LVCISKLVKFDFQYKITTIEKFTTLTNVHSNIDEVAKNAKTTITLKDPQVMILLMYYKFVLGRFVHMRWGDVLWRCVVKRPTTFNLISSNLLPIGIPINKPRLAHYVQISCLQLLDVKLQHMVCNMVWYLKKSLMLLFTLAIVTNLPMKVQDNKEVGHLVQWHTLGCMD
jgi:hypothetical protein